MFKSPLFHLHLSPTLRVMHLSPFRNLKLDISPKRTTAKNTIARGWASQECSVTTTILMIRSLLLVVYYSTRQDLAEVRRLPMVEQTEILFVNRSSDIDQHHASIPVFTY